VARTQERGYQASLPSGMVCSSCCQGTQPECKGDLELWLNYFTGPPAKGAGCPISGHGICAMGLANASPVVECRACGHVARDEETKLAIPAPSSGAGRVSMLSGIPAEPLGPLTSSGIWLKYLAYALHSFGAA
jgi:hypothetical protein